MEYADVLGIPFDFTAKPVEVKPQRPNKVTHVTAVSPDRDHLEIQFPLVTGYRVNLPQEKLTAKFTEDSKFNLTPELVGPSITTNAGIIGKDVDLNLVHTNELRLASLVMNLTKHLLETNGANLASL